MRSDAARTELRVVDDVDRAVARARATLIAQQREDGSFACDTDIGPLGPAQQLIVESCFGALSAADAALGLTRLRAWQRPDGSFDPYPHATSGSVTVTALVWAAALACGAGADDDLVRRARSYVDENGGLAAVTQAFRERSDVAALYLLASGHVDGTFLPRMPPGLGVVPLEQLLGRHVHAGNVMVMLVIAAVADRYGPPRGKSFLSATRRAIESVAIREHLCKWQNEDGSWNGSPLQSCLVLLGLHATGMSAADPPVKRALAWLDGMKRRTERGLDVCAMDNDIWSTALCALAVHAAGVHADAGAIARAQTYLLANQTSTPMRRSSQRKWKARRSGGWAFQRGNTTMPDTDDTGVVLAALGTLNGDRAPREVFRAIDDGVAWLRDMQNDDGGFPTFVWGLPSKKPGPMFLKDLPVSLDDLSTVGSFLRSPPPEYGDPSLEGVTGRVLWGLGRVGVGRDDPQVCDAVAFLVRQQCECGA